jgi:hypothetical protein
VIGDRVPTSRATVQNNRVLTTQPIKIQETYDDKSKIYTWDDFPYIHKYFQKQK